MEKNEGELRKKELQDSVREEERPWASGLNTAASKSSYANNQMGRDSGRF